MALGIVAELARSKLKDIAVVAFDDVALAEALEPALTVVAHDGDRSRARTITVPTRLIVRGSGEQPAPKP